LRTDPAILNEAAGGAQDGLEAQISINISASQFGFFYQWLGN
jgi:hypothetical protein